jgi:hypothetical protein
LRGPKCVARVEIERAVGRRRGADADGASPPPATAVLVGGRHAHAVEAEAEHVVHHGAIGPRVVQHGGEIGAALDNDEQRAAERGERARRRAGAADAGDATLGGKLVEPERQRTRATISAAPLRGQRMTGVTPQTARTAKRPSTQRSMLLCATASETRESLNAT